MHTLQVQGRGLSLVSSGDATPRLLFDLLTPGRGLDAAAPVVHALFTRQGGVSAGPFGTLNVSTSVGDAPASVAANRDKVLTMLGRPRAGLVMGGLIHGTTTARVTVDEAGCPAWDYLHDATGVPDAARGRVIHDVDALVTNDPRVTLLITAADCAQILVADPRRRAVGIAHAGWRGTAAGMTTKIVAAMTAEFGSDPADLRLAVGPSLGPCCARFSNPHDELPPWCEPYIHGHHVDLWAMNVAQARGAGLRDDRVAVAGVCTVCRRDLFFSHRGDHGKTGRFAAAIGVDV